MISGDLPTDYISAADIEAPQHPRKALRAFVELWLKVVDASNDGRDYEGIQIADGKRHGELAPLLAPRGRMPMDWSDDDSLWADE